MSEESIQNNRFENLSEEAKAEVPARTSPEAAFGRRLAQLVARRLGLRRRRQELWQKARAEKA